MPLLPRWFTSKNFAVQLITLALMLDPVGFVGSYLLGPPLGVDLLVGGVFGLAAASVPVSLLVIQRSA